MKHRVSVDCLERIRTTTGISEEQWAELGPFDYKVGSTHLMLEDRDLVCLAAAFDIAPERILDGAIDYSLLSRRWAGDQTALPERYRGVTRSRVRTSVHLLDSLELHRGWRARVNALRKLQAVEATVHDPDRLISMRFLTDLCEALEQEGFRESDIFELGKHSAISNLGTPLGKQLSLLPGPRALLETVFSDLIARYFDQNFTYKLLKLDETSCEVEAVPNAELVDEFGSIRVGSAKTCASRKGGFASLPYYLGLGAARVTETRCIHRLDPCCAFHIDFQGPLEQWNAQLKAKGSAGT